MKEEKEAKRADSRLEVAHDWKLGYEIRYEDRSGEKEGAYTEEGGVGI